MSKGGIFHFVPWHQCSQFEALGWEVAQLDLGSPHNAYSCLYKWAGKGRPVMPYTDEERDQQLKDFDYVWPGEDQ